MKQKKDTVVVYVITKLEMGGAQKVCLSLFDGLRTQGFYTTLISGARGLLVGNIVNDPHVILLSSLKREASIWSIWHELVSFWTLIKKLRRLKKEYAHIIVHTHSTKAGILGRWAAFFARIPLRVHTVHGYAFHHHQSWIIWLTIYFVELVTSLITKQFICVSSYDVAQGIKLFPFFTRKHTIIRAAVEDRFFIPAIRASKTNNPFVFGTISCFKPQKNLFDLLRAFKMVYTDIPDIRLEIIGDGILRNNIEAWIDANNLSASVVLHGWQQDVRPYLLMWNAFVLSSLWEGLPCTIIEARLCKLPIISYDTGGIHDVILHEYNGLLISQNNVAGLAENMMRVVHDEQLYSKLHTCNEDLSDFTTQNMITQHVALYKQLLTQRP